MAVSFLKILKFVRLISRLSQAFLTRCSTVSRWNASVLLLLVTAFSAAFRLFTAVIPRLKLNVICSLAISSLCSPEVPPESFLYLLSPIASIFGKKDDERVVFTLSRASPVSAAATRKEGFSRRAMSNASDNVGGTISSGSIGFLSLLGSGTSFKKMARYSLRARASCPSA